MRETYFTSSPSMAAALISATSFSFFCGRITVSMPARLAASTFSLMPPTGSTSPRSVISPVMATVWRTRRCV